MSNRPSMFPPVTPKPIIDAAFAFGRTQVLETAVELDVFTHIDNGQQTVTEVAKAAQASERGVRMLLDVLAAQGFLAKKGNRYELTETSQVFLSKKSPAYMGGWVLHMAQIQPAWEQLTDVVRTGNPSRDIHGSEDEGEFFSQFVHTLHVMNAQAAETVARQVLADRPQGEQIRVIDLGAGSGVWGFSFAKQSPTVHVTVADWPQVIERVTQGFAKQAQIEERVNYIAGDFREAELGDEQYDVATLGHICHGLGERQTKELFAKLRRAVKPDGHIVIAEFLPDEQRAHAEFPLTFAINMLVHTDEGDAFTMNEYRQWLQEAGFGEVAPADIPGAQTVILARSRETAENAA